MTLVSICVPTYRQVKFLRQTLHSILAQDYSQYEVVVTDDAPDDCVETVVRSRILEPECGSFGIEPDWERQRIGTRQFVAQTVNT